MTAQVTFLAREGRQLKGIPFASVIPSYTFATLPTPASGTYPVVFVTDGCAFTGAVGSGGTVMVQETTGAGTGVLACWNGSAWKIAGTAITVQA